MAVVSALFLLTDALPGDSADVRAGADRARAEQLRRQEGLDASAGVRLVRWWQQVLGGDLGTSWADGSPVLEQVVEHAQRTAVVALPAGALAAAASMALALVISWHRGRPFATGLSAAATVVAGMPEVVLVIGLVLLLAVGAGVVPAVSLLPPGAPPWAAPEVLVLPVLALALPATAWSTRLLLGPCSDVVAGDVVASARRRGVPALQVVLRHVLPPLLAPWVQALAVLASGVLAGGVVVESLLAYPGLGQLLAGAVSRRDTAVVQGAGLVLVTVSLALYTAADLLASRAAQR